ncbi:olfactory receptor 8D1-like [Pelodytes ibericus]
MEQRNHSIFTIKGISDLPDLQAPIFLLVLLIYLLTLGGNLTILLLVCLDRRLHNPMYFFLANLSTLDVSSTTVTLHKVLATFITGDNTISFSGCMTHVYFFMALECTELLVLSAMSYDRYVAICQPLHYHTIMNRTVCCVLAVTCWLSGFLEVIPHTSEIANFSCYNSYEINHFFCDVLPLMKITCSDTSLLKLLIVTEGVFISGLIPLIITLAPYGFIIQAILKMKLSTGRYKAFYTCSSHITVVTLLYTTLYCLYLTPTSETNLTSRKLFSLFNTAAVPMFNPLIYSLMNKDVKQAVRRQLDSLNGKFIQSRIANAHKSRKDGQR